MSGRSWCRWVWVAVGAGWLAGCGGETGMTKPQPAVPACSDMVMVSVTEGTSPAFSWEPDCAIGKLVVELADEELWGTETLGGNTYRSPIAYGVHPPGAAEESPAEPLAAGETYTVSLFRWYSVEPESLVLVGEQDFTP